MRLLFVIIAVILLASCQDEKQNETISFPTHFEDTNGEETATYLQVVDFDIQLAREFPEINIQTIGKTDSYNLLHLIIFNKDGDYKT